MANGRSFKLDFSNSKDYREVLLILSCWLESLNQRAPVVVPNLDDFLIPFPEVSPNAARQDRTVSSGNNDELTDNAGDSDEDTTHYVPLRPYSMASGVSEELEDDYDRISSGDMYQIPVMTDPNGPPIPDRLVIQGRLNRSIEVPTYDDVTHSADRSTSKCVQRPLPSPKLAAVLPRLPPKRIGKVITEGNASNLLRANAPKNHPDPGFGFPSPHPVRFQESFEPKEPQPMETRQTTPKNTGIPQSSDDAKNRRFNPVAAELAESFNASRGTGSVPARRGNTLADESGDVVKQHLPRVFSRVHISPSMLRPLVHKSDSIDSRGLVRTVAIEPSRCREGDIFLEIEYVSTPEYGSVEVSSSDGNRYYIVPEGANVLAELERAGFVTGTISIHDNDRSDGSSDLICSVCKLFNGSGETDCRKPWSCSYCTCDNSCSKNECSACGGASVSNQKVTAGNARANIGGIQRL